jgi:hypothetical protein
VTELRPYPTPTRTVAVVEVSTVQVPANAVPRIESKTTKETKIDIFQKKKPMMEPIQIIYYQLEST